MTEQTRSILLELVEGDLARVAVDVVVLKHAPERLYGAEKWIDTRLKGLLSSTYSDTPLDEPGTSTILSCSGLGAERVLVIGIGSLYRFTYRGIDQLARDTIEALAIHAPDAHSFSMTIHGPGIGLDPTECLKTQILGFASALRRIAKPISLEHIVIAERHPDLAQLLSQFLAEFSSDNPDVLTVERKGYSLRARTENVKVEEVRYASLEKRTVFVAMPFSNEFRNVYDYGIRLPVINVGRKPIRVDEEHFTGLIIEQVKEQIRGSELLIADITGSNPNVLFEVGFAEGAGVKTVLLCQEPKDLPFDVRGVVHIVYEPAHIRQLEEKLETHLRAILP